MTASSSNLLFIINPGSGNNNTDWKKEIESFFSDLPDHFEIYDIPNPCKPEIIKQKIDSMSPTKVIAVGGDGTVKLVAECLLNTKIPMALLPAGSANGMAKELNIPDDAKAALDVVLHGESKKIHLVKINNELCIHLGDIGFNAFVVKKFEDENTRGMWGYIKAAWKVLRSHSKMDVDIKINNEYIRHEAAMVVIANASTYGNGVVINPKGTLEDDLFEVIVIKKISFSEIFKMRFTQGDYNPDKTELFQTQALKIKSKHKVHFQVDGEYLGKINSIDAEIIPEALTVIVPTS
jgi:diacylglycerol kinase (ATP)